MRALRPTNLHSVIMKRRNIATTSPLPPYHPRSFPPTPLHSRREKSATPTIICEPTSTACLTAVRLSWRLWSHSASRTESTVPTALHTNGRVLTSHGCVKRGGVTHRRELHTNGRVFTSHSCVERGELHTEHTRSYTQKEVTHRRELHT